MHVNVDKKIKIKYTVNGKKVIIMNKLSGNKKILISVGVFVLIMAVAVGVLLILGSSDEPEYTDNTPQGNFNYNEEDLTSESLTSAPLTTSPAMNTQGVSFTPAQQAIMTAYTSANYYMTGSIYAEGTGTPTWTHIVRGATEGNIAMASALNIEMKAAAQRNQHGDLLVFSQQRLSFERQTGKLWRVSKDSNNQFFCT